MLAFAKTIRQLTKANKKPFTFNDELADLPIYGSENQLNDNNNVSPDNKIKYTNSKYQPCDDITISNSNKEYQSLFWMPMVLQTSIDAETIIDEMLSTISNFQDNTGERTYSMISYNPSLNKERREQILGDIEDNSDNMITRVEVVLKSENTKDIILSILKKHFLFSQMNDFELDDLIYSMCDKYVIEGDIIIKEGEKADTFYILEEGNVCILKDNIVIGTLSSGSSFGDLAIMYNSPRAATIVAKSNCTIWCLDRIFFRRAMVTSASMQTSNLNVFLSKIHLFENLSIYALNQLGSALGKKVYDKGEYIIKQGEIGELFFILYKGTVKVTKTGVDGIEKQILELKEGDVFGDRALIKKEPRAANVIADTNKVECYYLNSSDFNMILVEIVEELDTNNKYRLLQPSLIVKELNEHYTKKLIQSMKQETVYKGQRIHCNANTIVVVWSGTIESTNGTQYNTGDVVGDQDNDAVDVAGNLNVVSSDAHIGYLSHHTLFNTFEEQRADIDEAIVSKKREESKRRRSTLSGLLEGQDVTTNENALIVIQQSMEHRQSRAKVRRQSISKYSNQDINDIEAISFLGKGTFGTVYGCKNIKTGHVMAMKYLDKERIKNENQLIYIKREVEALQVFQHTFICEYYGTYLTHRKIIFLLEYIPGNDLWTFLYVNSVHPPGLLGGFDINQVAKYTSMILLALQHMHEHHYCYRDLKPDNILLDKHGYVKLVDFGLSKVLPFVNKTNLLQYRTFTLCGTPEYMAPEVVLTQGHDTSCDFWSLGILIYELLCKVTPFQGRNQQRTFEKIVHSQKYLSFKSGFDIHCKSFIRRLLHRNSGLRYNTNTEKGTNDITNHAFFKTQGIDFKMVLKRQINTIIPQMHDIGSNSNSVSNNSSNSVDEVINLSDEVNTPATTTYPEFDCLLESFESVDPKAITRCT